MDINEVPVNLTWEPTGSEEDPTSRLLSKEWLVINGVNVHTQAYAVKYMKGGVEVPWEEGGVQEIADDYFQSDWDAICTLYDDCFTTMEHEGRHYVLVCHPFGA